MTLMIAPDLQQTIEYAVERSGTHVIDLAVRGDRGHPVIEVYIDTEKGVTTEICASVSREIATAIDASGLISGQYRLDVSSPGIDRPLKFPWQYAKHAGRLLQVKFHSGAGAEELKGVLLDSSAEGLRVQVKGTTDPVEIPFSAILEARVPSPW